MRRDMTPESNNVRGAAVMIVAVGSLSLLDAGMKTLSSSYPPMQVAALRGLASLPFVLLWIAFRGGLPQLLKVRFPLHILRAALGIFMLAAFVYGVRALPLSEAYSIFFVAPLLITAFAAAFLRERVGWRRWLAIGVGLGAVVFILNPSGAGVISRAGLAIFLAATGYAISAITVRVLGRTDSTESMVFWLMFLVAIGAGLLSLPVWKPIEPQHWIVIAGIAVTGSIGQWAITEAFRVAEASFIAPFEYTALAWGAGLDFLLWQTTPGPRTLIGAAVIIGSGLYLMRRERPDWKKVEAAAGEDAVI
jgi:drug/metabolite transporter (DMT)-like permease